MYACSCGEFRPVSHLGDRSSTTEVPGPGSIFTLRVRASRLPASHQNGRVGNVGDPACAHVPGSLRTFSPFCVAGDGTLVIGEPRPPRAASQAAATTSGAVSAKSPGARIVNRRQRRPLRRRSSDRARSFDHFASIRRWPQQRANTSWSESDRPVCATEEIGEENRLVTYPALAVLNSW